MRISRIELSEVGPFDQAVFELAPHEDPPDQERMEELLSQGPYRYIAGCYLRAMVCQAT